MPKRNETHLVDNNCDINNNNQPSKTNLNYLALERYIVPADVTLTKSENNVCQVRNSGECNKEDIMCESNQAKNKIPIRKKSKWWLGDESLAKDIVKELELAYQNVSNSYTHIDVNSKIREDKSIQESKIVLNYDFDFTIEETVYILKKISHKVIEFPSLLLMTDEVEKNKIFKILSLVEHSLNGSHPTDNDCLPFSTSEEQLLLLVNKISKTFSLLSDKLHLAPSELRNQPISILCPPKTLTNTLAYLASTEYFKHCFIHFILHGDLDRVQLDKHKHRRYQLEKETTSIFGSSNSGKDIHQMHVELPKQMSSNTIKPLFKHTQPLTSIATDITQNVDVGKILCPEMNKRKVVQKDLENVDDHLELNLSEMTLQNSSDIFLYLSTVLNDLPNGIKTNNLLKLNPPTNLIKALDILYSDESVIKSGDAKRKSFNSLTVQNASDFLLSLSTVLQDAPPRIKNKLVLETNPPTSLVNAINILISSQSMVALSQKKEENTIVASGENAKGSQENFFDALEYLGEN